MKVPCAVCLCHIGPISPCSCARKPPSRPPPAPPPLAPPPSPAPFRCRRLLLSLQSVGTHSEHTNTNRLQVVCAADKRAAAVPELRGGRSRGVGWKEEEQEQGYNLICGGGSEGAERHVHPQERGRKMQPHPLPHHLLVVDYSKIDVVPRRVKTGASASSCLASVSALFSLHSKPGRSSSLVGCY